MVVEEGTGSTVPMVGRRGLPLTAGRVMLLGAGPTQLLWFRDEFSLPEKRHTNTAVEDLKCLIVISKEKLMNLLLGN